MKALQSTWAVALIGALLFLATTVLSLQPAQLQPSDDDSHTFTLNSGTAGAMWEFHNPELNQLIEDLRKEKDALATRTQQLQDLQDRLQTERHELNQLTQTVHQMQVDFDKAVVRVRDDEIVNLKRLAKTYASMSADGAATILAQMEDDQLIKLLMFMKESENAQILETLAKGGSNETRRAVTLTERLKTAAFPQPAGKPANP